MSFSRPLTQPNSCEIYPFFLGCLLSNIIVVIILVIEQIGLPLRGRPILLITSMITDQIGPHSVLLPLLISTFHYVLYFKNIKMGTAMI